MFFIKTLGLKFLINDHRYLNIFGKKAAAVFGNKLILKIFKCLIKKFMLNVFKNKRKREKVDTKKCLSV